MKNNLIVICAMLFALNLTTAAQVIVPINGVTPTLTPVTVNAGVGDQNDPHLSGDWAVYASGLSIRYYNFATNTDAQIPMGASARDLLSDVSGSKIVFSRIVTGVKTAVMVFDASTPLVAPIELDPAAGVTRIGSAIGGNTVAYIDFGLAATGELVIHDLSTSTSVRATNDSLRDENPAVSPDGSVVTWTHYPTAVSNPDIWQAVRNGAVWNVSTVAVSLAYFDPNPDTNGMVAVYTRGFYLPSQTSQTSDIFWRAVSGGSEVQIRLPTLEAFSSIAGNYISLESRPTLFETTDIYVYDMNTNLLYGSPTLQR